MGYLANCTTSSAVSTCEPWKKSGVPQPRKLRVFKLQELTKATNSFSTTNIVGKGSHSCVYKAVLNDGQVVAVKRPAVGRRTLQDLTSFENELEVLSVLQHRNLVNLIGYCNESAEKLLVVEYMDNGTLFDLLHSSTQPLSWPLRVHMALQTATAILALHNASPPIIHRDVKSSNILIDSNWNAKLGDLGLALHGRLEDVVSRRAPPAGTMGYIDPQYETPSRLSSKSDVFSFGILLLEIMSGRNAIDLRFNPSSIVDWAMPLIRDGKALALCDPAVKLPLNTKSVKQLALVAARSVTLSRERRPAMAEVVESIRQIRRTLPTVRFGGKTLRSTPPSSEAARCDTSEDFSSDGTSSGKSETLPILEKGSGMGRRSVSPTDSCSSNHSHRSTNRTVKAATRIADLSVVSASKQKPSSKPFTRTSEQPLFDPGSSATCYGRMKIERFSSFAVPFVSRRMSCLQLSVIDNEIPIANGSSEGSSLSSRKPPGRGEPSSSGTSPSCSTQQDSSRVKVDEKSVSEFCQHFHLDSSLSRTSKNPSKSEQLCSPSRNLHGFGNQPDSYEVYADACDRVPPSSPSEPVADGGIDVYNSEKQGRDKGDKGPKLAGRSIWQSSRTVTTKSLSIWQFASNTGVSRAASHIDALDLCIPA